MKGIEVELLDWMGNDLTVSNVARVSFDKWKMEFDDKDAKLVHYLADHAHTSPFRHTCIQLRCKAPVFLARQLQKHTVGLTWNEVSRRYVDAPPEFFIPDSWRSRPVDGIKQGSGVDEVTNLAYYYEEGDLAGFESIKNCYDDFISDVVNLYDHMLRNNVAPEMARMVLPQSMLTSWVWTGSLQAFFHMCQLRLGEGAQEEAKVFAKLVEDELIKLFPVSYEALKNASTSH